MGTLIDITPQLGPHATKNRREAHRRRELVLRGISHLRCVVGAARGLLDDPWDEFERRRLERMLEGSDRAVEVLRELITGP